MLEEPAVISFAAIPPSVPIVSIENGAARTLGISGPIPGDDDHRSIRSGDRDGKPDPGPDAAGAAQKLPPTAAALIMASLGLSALLSALDITIVTTAMPVIAAEFHSNAAYIWIGSSYVLASTAIAPVWGSVADIWGRKPIMLIALAVFLGGSLMCALAETMDTMIIGRVFQGFGTSGKAVVGSIIISDLFPLRDRGLYLAVLSTVWAVGASAGPLLGGVLTTKLRYARLSYIVLSLRRHHVQQRVYCKINTYSNHFERGGSGTLAILRKRLERRRPAATSHLPLRHFYSEAISVMSDCANSFIAGDGVFGLIVSCSMIVAVEISLCVLF